MFSRRLRIMENKVISRIHSQVKEDLDKIIDFLEKNQTRIQKQIRLRNNKGEFDLVINTSPWYRKDRKIGNNEEYHNHVVIERIKSKYYQSQLEKRIPDIENHLQIDLQSVEIIKNSRELIEISWSCQG